MSVPTVQAHGLWSATFYRLVRQRPAGAALLALAVLAIGCMLGPAMPRADAWDGLGTSTLLAGRLTLLLAVGTGVISLGLGLVHGALIGRGGAAERMSPWLMLLAIGALLAAGLGVPGGDAVLVFAAAGTPGWLYTMLTTAARARALRARSFVDAARLAGLPAPVLVRRHLLPNLVPAVLVCAVLTVPLALFVESTLSLAGFGLQEPSITWGVLARQGLARLEAAPAETLLPLAALAMATLAFQLIGRGLQAALLPPPR